MCLWRNNLLTVRVDALARLFFVNSKQFRLWIDNYSSSTQAIPMPLIMGIVNITPDSFSDGGQYFNCQSALEHAEKLAAEGADIIDIGGESSRPGAIQIDVQEELRRVIPVIKQLHERLDVCLSIDTSKAEVMLRAVEAGAGMINDVTALAEKEALCAAAELNVPVCLLHMKGKPLTMQHNPVYDTDVIEEIDSFFEQQIERCLAAGLDRKQLVIDPGFGFGKSVDDNLRIIKQSHQFQRHNRPVMLGVSRKSTLGILLNKPVDARLFGGIAASVMAMLQGVSIIRTHDVAATKEALQVAYAICSANGLQRREG